MWAFDFIEVILEDFREKIRHAKSSTKSYRKSSHAWSLPIQEVSILLVLCLVCVWDVGFSLFCRLKNGFTRIQEADIYLKGEDLSNQSIAYHTHNSKLFPAVKDGICNDEWEELKLKVGSVHQVQGAEFWLGIKTGSFYVLFPA